MKSKKKTRLKLTLAQKRCARRRASRRKALEQPQPLAQVAYRDRTKYNRKKKHPRREEE